MTYKLTTPFMHGDNVRALQNALHTHGWYSGPIDGIYGLLTAQAVHRAKYYLGYPKPDNVAGDTLHSYLTGGKPTLVMAALALKRKPKPVKPTAITLGAHALRILVTNTGMKEDPPGSNKCLISEWYGLIGPWCAMTGMWAYDHAGSKTFNKANGHKYSWAYVPNIVHDARNGNHGLTLTHNPQPGDGICYDWPGESPGLADHYGTFEKWIDKSKGTFYAREGNTAVGNDSNGGELMQRERTLSLVQIFTHIAN